MMKGLGSAYDEWNIYPWSFVMHKLSCPSLAVLLTGHNHKKIHLTSGCMKNNGGRVLYCFAHTYLYFRVHN